MLTGHNPDIKPQLLEVIHHHVRLKGLQGLRTYRNQPEYVHVHSTLTHSHIVRSQSAEDWNQIVIVNKGHVTTWSPLHVQALISSE